MLSTEYTNTFQKDVKKMIKRGKSKSKLADILYLLSEE